MQRPTEPMESPATQLVRVHQRSPGAYTAEVVGLPEVQATAGSPLEAVQEVRNRLRQELASGRLVLVELSQAPPPHVGPPPHDPNDTLEQEFLEDLARFRREDLE